MQAARGASLTSDHRPRPGLLIGIAVVGWAIDLGSKILAEDRLSDRGPVRVIGSLLELTLTRNPGAAFSTGTSLTPFITIFAILAFAVVIWLGRRTRSLAWTWAFGLLLAGIAGNLTDRLFREPGPLRGHVIDFIRLPHWPVFNVADICINLAAVLIVLASLRGVPMSGRTPAGHDADQDSLEVGR